jgi:hypothetical protein
MKKLLLVLVLATGVFAPASAQATPIILGAISISGTMVPVNGATGVATALISATALDFTVGSSTPTPGVPGAIQVQTRSGDLAVIPYLASGTIKDLSLTGASFGTNYLAPLSTDFQLIINGANTFSFDLLSLSISKQTADVITLYGTGTMNLTGFAPTPGIFLYSGQGVAGSYSFSATDAVPVPDPGSSLVLFGMGLVGLVGAARRWRRN